MSASQDPVRRSSAAMDAYENLGIIGEGSYGVVLKCRHKETGQMVAVKKFLETEDDKLVKKIALREIRMLKKLQHENLVNLLEVFRRKRRLYLVFEYVDHTILEELEDHPKGLDSSIVREYTWQILRGIDYIHSQNVIHRDIKPENLLVSKQGILKICDFGFARPLATRGESCTDYVATRWYRAPELLVGDTKYGKEVDIWAVGCLFAEMLTGDPLFPGDSDIDQLFHIIRSRGPITPQHQELVSKNPMYKGMKLEVTEETMALKELFKDWSPHELQSDASKFRRKSSEDDRDGLFRFTGVNRSFRNPSKVSHLGHLPHKYSTDISDIEEERRRRSSSPPRSDRLMGALKGNADGGHTGGGARETSLSPGSRFYSGGSKFGNGHSEGIQGFSIAKETGNIITPYRLRRDYERLHQQRRNRSSHAEVSCQQVHPPLSYLWKTSLRSLPRAIPRNRLLLVAKHRVVLGVYHSCEDQPPYPLRRKGGACLTTRSAPHRLQPK
ncbi:unnamed protein product [Cyprideis torosa]|uniref:cyclin-dependent kinase n=1 Tax=Cyprideis torosa TaxID=163714 RepID=A0A7R8ZJ52_9CRUS|nr:unnamed protein product [Cyprideis torosa]CAG0879108.1 unnamed protein product [Cyprideis torosa]